MEHEGKPTFTITLDPETGSAQFKMDGQIPIPLLVNVLEMAKLNFLNMQLQQAAQQLRVIPPNGAPIPRMRGF